MKTYIYLAISAVLAAAILSAVFFQQENKRQKKENTELRADLKILTTAYTKLSASFQEVAKLKTYSVSLAPNINNKVISTFGSTKNVTLQYYFTMDGNKIEAKADSIYEMRRLE